MYGIPKGHGVNKKIEIDLLQTSVNIFHVQNGPIFLMNGEWTQILIDWSCQKEI